MNHDNVTVILLLAIHLLVGSAPAVWERLDFFLNL